MSKIRKGRESIGEMVSRVYSLQDIVNTPVRKPSGGEHTVNHFFFLLILIFFLGCGKKEIVVQERIDDPLVSFESVTHGINPKSTTIKIYSDGYVLKSTTDDFSGKRESKGVYISSSQVADLKSFFIQEGFLDAEPVRLPALYGGEVISITFTADGKSNSIKFLDGTKIPYSVERCRDRVENLFRSLF